LDRSFALHLHHVGYVVKEIGPVAESYIRRYGYEPATPKIHDPLQTAFVQFLRLPGDQSYLELVAPDGPDSKLSQAASRRGGLNHLCYTAGPLEETIRQLEGEGMSLLSEPKPAVAFNLRRICWLIGTDPVPIELVERRSDDDRCAPAEPAG
jgi:methylmalonyl-CoA/ethylmalonyl-CoA epimerase